MFKMSKKYDPAYKLEICKTIDSGHASTSEISRETGIPENTLYTWMKKYRANRERPFVGSGHILPENEETVRLRRENKDLREENEILKKAAALSDRARVSTLAGGNPARKGNSRPTGSESWSVRSNVCI